MASIGHIAVGFALARHVPTQGAGQRVQSLLVCSALAMLPDADVIAFALHVPYAHTLGHRGASHSLAFAVAVALLFAAARPFGMSRWRAFLLAALALVSHGLLDAMTTGGLGAALLWPLSNERIFFAWRPIPVAPIGLRVLSPRGLRLMAHEALLFAPFWLYALWPPPRRPAATAARGSSGRRPS